MDNINSSVETINAVKLFLKQLPNLSYANNCLPYFNIEKYGAGIEGFNKLKNEFEQIDFTKSAEFIDLDKKIAIQKKEVEDLEYKHTNLISLIGEDEEGGKGSLAKQILINLNSEIESLIENRNNLLQEIKINEELKAERIATQKEKETIQIKAFQKKTIELEDTYKTNVETLNAKYEEEKLNIGNK